MFSTWFWGRPVFGCQKVPLKVPPIGPRFHQAFTNLALAPTFSKFHGVFGSLGQIRRGLPKGSAEGSTNWAKVPPSLHQPCTCTNVLKISWCLWFSGADPSWAAKKFRRRFHQLGQGSTKPSPTLHLHQRSQNFMVSLVLWGRSVVGCQKVPQKVPPRLRQVSPRFHQSSQSLVVSLVLWGRSVVGCQKVPQKVPPRLRQVSPRFHQSSQSLVVSLVVWGRPVLGCHKFPRKVPARSRQSFPSSVVSLVLWGRSVVGSTKVSTRSVLGCQRFRGRFHQDSAKFHQGPQSSLSFVVSLVLWGRSILGCQGSTEVPLRFRGRFHQSFVKVPPKFAQCSWCFWFSGTEKVAWKVPPKFHQGFAKVPPRFQGGSTKVSRWLRKFRDVSGFLGRVRFVSEKGFAEGSSITS